MTSRGQERADLLLVERGLFLLSASRRRRTIHGVRRQDPAVRSVLHSRVQDPVGVHQVEGNPDSKAITVKWDNPANLEKIKATLKEINYPAAD